MAATVILRFGRARGVLCRRLRSRHSYECMGMFDTVFLRRPLPAPEPRLSPPLLEDLRTMVELSGLQTKDMECLLDKYVIHADGSLERETREWFDTPLFALPEMIDFHGRLRCYTVFVPRTHPAISLYVEYTFKFTDGVLVEVEKARLQCLDPSADLREILDSGLAANDGDFDRADHI